MRLAFSSFVFAPYSGKRKSDKAGKSKWIATWSTRPDQKRVRAAEVAKVVRRETALGQTTAKSSNETLGLEDVGAGAARDDIDAGYRRRACRHRPFPPGADPGPSAVGDVGALSSGLEGSLVP